MKAYSPTYIHNPLRNRIIVFWITGHNRGQTSGVQKNFNSEATLVEGAGYSSCWRTKSCRTHVVLDSVQIFAETFGLCYIQINERKKLSALHELG
jgi:hypothetical protein